MGLASAGEGSFVVSCRDLPQLVTQGDDRAHALAEAAHAVDEVAAACMQGATGRNHRAPPKLSRGSADAPLSAWKIPARTSNPRTHVYANPDKKSSMT